MTDLENFPPIGVVMGTVVIELEHSLTLLQNNLLLKSLHKRFGNDFLVLEDGQRLARPDHSELIAALEANTRAHTTRPFVGEEHPRYMEWRDEAAAGNTLLGLADWLEHNPVEED